MSDLINSCLKEISSELNQLQMKKKDFIIKFEPEVKNQILLEMQEILQKIKDKVLSFYLTIVLSNRTRVRMLFRSNTYKFQICNREQSSRI